MTMAIGKARLAQGIAHAFSVFERTVKLNVQYITKPRSQFHAPAAAKDYEKGSLCLVPLGAVQMAPKVPSTAVTLPKSKHAPSGVTAYIVPKTELPGSRKDGKVFMVPFFMVPPGEKPNLHPSTIKVNVQMALEPKAPGKGTGPVEIEVPCLINSKKAIKCSEFLVKPALEPASPPTSGGASSSTSGATAKRMPARAKPMPGKRAAGAASSPSGAKKSKK